jgi:hypothetical protein
MALGIALVISAVAAAASTYLRLVDIGQLACCGCDPGFRLAAAGCQVPPLLVALVGTLRLAAPRVGLDGWACVAIDAIAIIDAALVLLLVGFGAVPGARHAAVLGSHVLLMMLLVIRRILR